MPDIPGNNSTTEVLTIGGSASSTLESLGDHDWFRIDLVAGQSITVFVDGTTLEDPYVYIHNAAGTVIFSNDDINPGVIRDSKVSFTVPTTGTYYIDVGSFEESYAGDYQVTVSVYTPPPIASNDEIAQQLVEGYWGTGEQHHFDVTQGGSITVNITALTAAGQTLARAALTQWSDIIGVSFPEVLVGGQIVFDDSQSGAATDANWSEGIITSAHVNVSTAWIAQYGTELNSYSFQTYIHEIGHALGLGHAGYYNVTASYPTDALFQNDAWVTSIMSYFSPTENTYFAGQGFTENFVVTPMMADIVAMAQLYGLSTTTRTGNTIYGFNSNAGSAIYDATQYPDVAYTIFDSGGIDTLDYSGFSSNQRINLNPETFSAVGPGFGNVAIGRGVVIENAIGGSGNDLIVGNSADNVLNGGGGLDTASYAEAIAGVTVNLAITGAQNTVGAGNDTLIGIEHLTGSAFSDTLTGSGVDNVLLGGEGNDVMNGGAGGDVLDGGAGFDAASYSGASAAVTVSLAVAGAQSTGGAGTDTLIGIEALFGSAFGDTLIGDSAANVLNGKGGVDVMQGGAGDDTYYVDDAGDQVVELASTHGTDLVFSSVSYALGNKVENLTLTGAAAIDATGNSGANLLIGNSAANVLNGKAGVDTMQGGAGDDTYFVDDTGDQVIELASTHGIDQVYSSVSFALGNKVENLTLTGTAAIDAAGNGLANVLVGNSAANVLSGGAGADTMTGGKGDDTYFVDDAGDQVIELASTHGIDQVFSSISFTLGNKVENLTLTGAAAINATGNDLANVLVGNSAANVLNGGAGNDTLDGGAGKDQFLGGFGADLFVFDQLTDFSGHDALTCDVIADFNQAELDRIDLSALDANAPVGGDQAFDFIGNAAFGGIAGQLRYEQVDGNTYLSGDTNGDGLADFMIQVSGSHSLQPADLLL